MAGDGGTSAPATGTTGQAQPNQDPGTQPAGTTPSTGQGGGNHPSGPADTGRNGNGTDGLDVAAWAELAKEFGPPDKVRERLGHARTWEQRAKDNKQAADQLPTLQEQLDQFRQDMSARDERDIDRAGKTALAQLKGELGQAGVRWDDIDEELRPDPVRLLADGEPNDEAITRYAKALTKHAGRPAPDHDQGRRSDGAPSDMNSLIRRAAGRA